MIKFVCYKINYYLKTIYGLYVINNKPSIYYNLFNYQFYGITLGLYALKLNA